MLNPVEIKEVISVWWSRACWTEMLIFRAFDVLPFEPFQLVVLAGVALDGLDASQALDHLAD